MNDLLIKIPMLVVFFGVMTGIGIYCKKNSTNVDGFVLGGRSVGPFVVFILISVVLALVQHSSRVTFIAQLMGVSWGALAGAFLAPFLFGLYWKKTTKAAVWTSFLFSTVVMLSNILIPQYFPAILKSPINAGAFCMLAGLILVPVVSLITKKPDTTHVQQVFSCYDSATDSVKNPKEANP